MNPQHDTDRSAAIGEQVSALCDGHLDPAGVDTLLAHCRESDESLSRWHSYQLIGAVLRGEEAVVAGRAPQAFLAAVRAGIEQDPPAARPEMASQTVMVRAPAANADAFRWKLVSGFASVVSTSQGTLIRDPALERQLAEHRQHGGVSAFQTSTGFIRNATYDADAR